jgi:hypothetical protein
MFVVVTGALQTLPNDIYEAADLDGANAWAKFRTHHLAAAAGDGRSTVGGFFAFNFNNFTVIKLYNHGGPPMPNVPTPVGYTDILATYTYNIAFGAPGCAGLWLRFGDHDDDLPDPVHHHAVPVPLHEHVGREGAQCLTKDVSPLRSVRCSAANASP